MLGKKEKNPNPIYVPTDLVEDILFRLPLKSIIKFKTVSKQWRTTLESKSFVERRMTVEKNQKFLAAGDCAKSRFKGDEEIEMVYLQCDDATRTSLTCDGLVCIPIPGWINVLNPSTGELIRFPSCDSSLCYYKPKLCLNIFPGNWAMGFGKDVVNGSYKVVRMLHDDPSNHCDCAILNVNTREWRKLKPPPYKIEPNRKSVFVNGSIYWLNFVSENYCVLLAFDLHNEEFRDVPARPPPIINNQGGQLVNLQDRLAIADTTPFQPEFKLEIWSMDAQEKNWSMTYSISLLHSGISENRCITPLSVTKKGGLYFYDSEKKVFKYGPEKDLIRCLSKDICVISTFVENLVRLGPKISTSSGYKYRLSYLNQVPAPKISTSTGYKYRLSYPEQIPAPGDPLLLLDRWRCCISLF